MKRLQTLGLIAIIAFSTQFAAAAEQRCTELGTNCICSEPFNTSQLTRNSYWFNPADSTTKQCAMTTDMPGGAIEANPINQVVMRSDPTALSHLPSGHSVQYFGAGIEGHNNVFFAGHVLSASDPVARVAARWYIYHTPDYQFKNEGVCENSKMQSLGILGIDKSFGTPHAYNFTSFACAGNPCPLPRDCCWIGPGPTTLNPPDWKGKWWRVETVVANRAGPGFDIKMYMKNITDNTPEITVMDLSQPCPDCGAGEGWVPNTQIIPPARLDRLAINHYRQGTCAGWSGFSHYLVAAWNTNAGQRIGAALEVEGARAGGSSSSAVSSSASSSSTSSADTTPPAPPTGLEGSVASSSSSSAG